MGDRVYAEFERYCVSCGKPLTGNSICIYCSTKCRSKVYCHCCSGKITDRRRDSIYCSDLCGNNLRNRRHHAISNHERNASNRYYRKTNPIKPLLSRIKNKCKTKNILFDIDESDIIIPEYCPVLGIKLVWNVGSSGKQGYRPDSPSVDRIYPDRGYVRGNVRIISARANLLKNDATVEELEAVLADLRKLRE